MRRCFTSESGAVLAGEPVGSADSNDPPRILFERTVVLGLAWQSLGVRATLSVALRLEVVVDSLS